MMKLVLKAAMHVIAKQVEKINDLKAVDEARIEEAFARGVLEARARYAQAWTQGSGTKIQDVQFTVHFVRELGVLSKRYYEEGFPGEAGGNHAG